MARGIVMLALGILVILTVLSARRFQSETRLWAHAQTFRGWVNARNARLQAGDLESAVDACAEMATRIATPQQRAVFASLCVGVPSR